MDAAAHGGFLRFSTNDLPERDRLPVFRELHGRQLMRVDLEPLPDLPFQVDVALQASPGLGVMLAATSGGRVSRTRELVRDGDDDLFLGLVLAGRSRVEQRGRSVDARKGDALLMSCDAVSSVFYPGRSRFVGLKVPRAALAPLVTGIDDAVMRLIPRDDGALRLLGGYLDLLARQGGTASPELHSLAASHVHDLVALALGATRDAATTAAERGVRAAHLRAIKADILERLAHPDLGPAAVAARLNISESYLRKLLASDGTSFSDFVLEARLARAHRLLRNARFNDRTVASLAFQVGFGDLSYFNRSFRRRYGATPSDVRAAARDGTR